MIERLIERGHAYAADGHVLFNVPSDPDYGMLSHRSLEDMLDGARVEVAPYKRDPKDFVLWKPSTPELPGWDSPWGRGRPGWHIECSAMIRKHLGSTIDIHGGGSDLTFPHHENELAQGRCVDDGATYVRYWMHNGMLTLGDEKMSKSVGNIITLRDLLERNGGEVLRYALLSGNYRSPLAWSDDLLKQAQASLDRIYQALLDIPPGNATHPDQFKHAPLEAFPPAVVEALADDLNTTGALAAMHGIVSDMHRANDPAKSRALRDQLIAGAWLMGLLTDDPEAHFKSRATRGRRRTSTNASRRASPLGKRKISSWPMPFAMNCSLRASSSKTRRPGPTGARRGPRPSISPCPFGRLNSSTEPRSLRRRIRFIFAGRARGYTPRAFRC